MRYGYYSSLYHFGLNESTAAVIAVLAGIWAIFALIAWGKLFIKAGLPWERIFVPAYGTYWQYKVADAPGIFWGTIGLGVLYYIIVVASAASGYHGRNSGTTVAAVFAVLTLAAIVVLYIIYLVKLAKAYGKGGGFALGLILLYPIFILILGFGDSEYVGLSGNYQGPAVTESWTCPSCGTINPASRAVCERCGTKK